MKQWKIPNSLGLALILVPGIAWAQDDTLPSIEEITQDGQEITP